MLNRTWLFCACAAAAISGKSFAAVRFVNAHLTTGSNNGTSWANAYRGPTALATALVAAQANDDIWVAAGTYVPGVAGDRGATFTLRTDVDLVGGFAGGETSRDQAQPHSNLTILSGDLAGDDEDTGSRQDNAYHVLSAIGPTISGADVHGFTIRGGTADAATDADRGGGLLMTGGAQVNFTQCVFTQNSCIFGGGAAYINTCVARFTDCTFENNLGGTYGGALDTNDGFTTFTSCYFRGNSAGRAGALEVYGSNGISQINNCLFQGNIAMGNGGGGALWIGQGGVCTLMNTTVIDNDASVGSCGGVRSSSNVTLRNSIVWGNTGTSADIGTQQLFTSSTATVQYSCITGGRDGAGNIDSNPLVLPDGTLRWGSPCIDAANGATLAGAVATDLGRRPRELDDPAMTDSGIPFHSRGVPDMGAFEFQRSSCVADVSGSADAPDGAVTIDDLLAFLIAFEGGTLPADVDNGQSGGVPDEAVEISDLLYFLVRFEAGC